MLSISFYAANLENQITSDWVVVDDFSGMHQFWVDVDMGVVGMGGVRWVVVTARKESKQHKWQNLEWLRHPQLSPHNRPIFHYKAYIDVPILTVAVLLGQQVPTASLESSYGNISPVVSLHSQL